MAFLFIFFLSLKLKWVLESLFLGIFVFVLCNAVYTYSIAVDLRFQISI